MSLADPRLVARSALQALALLWTASARADDDVFVSHWLVSPNGTGCSAYTSYSDDSTMYLSFDYGPDDAYLAFNNPKFKSLEKDRKFELETYFQTKGKLDDGWGKIEFKAIYKGEESLGLMSQKLTGSTFLKDFASSDKIAFFRDERLVDQFPLKGTAEMVAKLRQCALDVERKHPSDPLAD